MNPGEAPFIPMGMEHLMFANCMMIKDTPLSEDKKDEAMLKMD